MKTIWKRMVAAGMVMMLLFTLSACKKSGGIRFTTGLDEEELFRLEDEICTRQEAMIFILSQKTHYENAYGKDIWDVKINGETFAQYMRDNLQDFLAKMKCMILMAKKYEVTLTEEEKAFIEQAAKDYMGGLSEETKNVSGIREADAKKAFHDYYLANRLMETLTKDAVPEISEDEARVIIVQQIYLSTEGLDENGKEEKRLLAESLCRQAQDGADFAVLSKNYNETEVFEVWLARGEAGAQFEAAAFSLSSEEISPVVETANGFHIIRCVNNYDVQKTAENREVISRNKKEDRFYEYYDSFVKTVVAEYNKKAWEAIDYHEDLGVPGSDFYVIYNQYFGE